MFIKPVISIEKEELFTPKHSCKSLAHHVCFVSIYQRLCTDLSKSAASCNLSVKTLSNFSPKELVLLFLKYSGKSDFDYLGFPCTNIYLIMSCHFCPFHSGIDNVLISLNQIIINSIFHEGTFVGLSGKEFFMNGFVFGKQQRHFTFKR